MKIGYKKIVSCVAFVALLAACGNSDSSSSTTSQNATSLSALEQAHLENPSIATQILPPYAPSVSAGVTSITSQNTLGDAPNNTNVEQNVSVGELENIYENWFCQLNSEHGVTLQSSECQKNIKYIASQDMTGNFDLNKKPILNNSLSIESVLFSPMTYKTTVELPTGTQTFNVSGGLIMPNVDKSKIKGILVYFHGTTFNKTQVGSYWSNPETQIAAAVFASQGYIVAIPDYVGQGVDWQNVHPYVLYPKVSAKTAADMINAAQTTLQNKYGFDSNSTLKLFSAGYSEGGAYSVWFNSFLTDNTSALGSMYKLTHSVGMEGAYSTSNATKGYLFSDLNVALDTKYHAQRQMLVNLVKPILSADALLSYATYSVGANYNQVLNEKFFAIDCNDVIDVISAKFKGVTCKVNGEQLNMLQAFSQPNTTIAEQILLSGLGKTANGYTYPGLTVYHNFITNSMFNSIYSLVSKDLASKDGMAQLDSVLLQADVNLTNVPVGNVSIITLEKDSVVTPDNFNILYGAYKNKFKYALKINQNELQVVSPFSFIPGVNDGRPLYVPVDHMHGPVYEFLYALHIYNEFANQ
jgi:hypothetical protein